MEQATLGIGTRLQHTLHGPGVIIVVKYATYLIAFINTGIKEIDKADTQLDEIIPENVTAEVETVSETVHISNDNNKLIFIRIVIPFKLPF